MQLPVKAHYATLAMLALAQKHAARELLPAKVIAREQKIPSQFLLQIMQHLRAAGLISSTRGAQGGFALVRPPEQSSVADIVDAGCNASPQALDDAGGPLTAVVSDVWAELQQRQRGFLESVRLADLLLRAGSAVPMFYI